MCKACFLIAVQTACENATVFQLRQVVGTPLQSAATSFLGVPYNYKKDVPPCTALPYDNKQTTKATYYNEAKKKANAAIPLKQLALRNEVIAALPDARIGQRFMELINKDDRDLDRMCRLLLADPLAGQSCVAACWSPVQWDVGAPQIIISTNRCNGELGTTNKEMKKQILSFFSAYVPPEAKYSVDDKQLYKQSHSSRLPTEYPVAMRKYLKARDLAKLNRADSRVLTALKSGNFYVIKTESADVHAELRILEYIDWYSREHELFKPDTTDVPVYIGVSLLCCSKCVAFFTLYRNCPAKLFLPTSRGQHGIMDSNWQAPPRLSALIDRGALIEKIVHSSLPPRDLQPGVVKNMTEDLSDSDSDSY